MATARRCEKALEEHEDRLGALPNVSGLGIVPAEEGEGGSGGLAVAVYVTRKRPRAKLGADEAIPKRLVFRDRGATRWVPVRVIEQGEVVLETPESGGLGKEPL